jgi:uncharacterized membrane protein (UPF0127 family)
MNKYTYIFFAVAGITLGYVYYFYKVTNSIISENLYFTQTSSQTNNGKSFVTKTLQIGSTDVTVYVADTAMLREKGLGGFTELPANHGMLFVFPHPEMQTFWMKDMHFDIDIVWIDADMQVVGVDKNVGKDSYNKYDENLSETFQSPSKVQYVLELPAGDADRLGISIHTTLNSISNIR